MFEHSIFISSVVSIGHISTIALAAATMGFMTAGVSGLSVIQGMAEALDTVLPSAWTSGNPPLVGLWTQRMGMYNGFIRVEMLIFETSCPPTYHVGRECFRSPS